MKQLPQLPNVQLLSTPDSYVSPPKHFQKQSFNCTTHIITMTTAHLKLATVILSQLALRWRLYFFMKRGTRRGWSWGFVWVGIVVQRGMLVLGRLVLYSFAPDTIHIPAKRELAPLIGILARVAPSLCLLENSTSSRQRHMRIFMATWQAILCFVLAVILSIKVGSTGTVSHAIMSAKFSALSNWLLWFFNVAIMVWAASWMKDWSSLIPISLQCHAG